MFATSCRHLPAGTSGADLAANNNNNNNNFRVSNIRVSNRTLIYNVCPKSPNMTF